MSSGCVEQRPDTLRCFLLAYLGEGALRSSKPELGVRDGVRDGVGPRHSARGLDFCLAAIPRNVAA